jgi:hypothetical protein
MTVKVGKMFTNWKLRAIPNLESLAGPMPVMSCSLKNTLPLLGLSRPVRTLISVVLPAPFGPIMDTNSPSWI